MAEGLQGNKSPEKVGVGQWHSIIRAGSATTYLVEYLEDIPLKPLSLLAMKCGLKRALKYVQNYVKYVYGSVL